MIRRCAFTMTIVLAGIGGIACSDSNSPSKTVASVDIAAVKDTVRGGLTSQFTATPKDASGKVVSGQSATWASSDTTIAVVTGGLVTGVRNGTATISATIKGIVGNHDITVWRGVTGTWAGSVTPPGCAITASLTEDINSGITGTATLASPCSADNFTLTGSNAAGGVADSVSMTWTGSVFTLVLDGPFNGTSTLTGHIVGGGCTGVTCPYSMTRSTIIATAKRFLRADGAVTHPTHGAGLLGVSR